MEKLNQLTEEESKKRKFLFVLPLLILPFVTLAFWAMGGGHGKQAELESIEGFNLELPNAASKDEMKDKLSFYESAEKDSLRYAEMLKKDPYYMSFDNQISDDLEEYGMDFSPYSMDGGKSYQDPNERKIYEKLGQLDAVLQNQSRTDHEGYPSSISYSSRQEQDGLREDLDRLEQMMLMMQSAPNEQDPEMQQISSVLETVLDIQHPERVQERLRERSEDNRGQVFAVSAQKKETPFTTLENKQIELNQSLENEISAVQQVNRFYGLDNQMMNQEEHNAIEAVVHETQTLVSGATVKLRLLNDVYISGRLISKDHFVFGTANLQGETLQIDISNIQFDNSLFPVKLQVHDMDGLVGIRIPGAITRDVGKQSGQQTIQSMNLGMYSPTLGAQAANAGIELGRNLLSRNIKLIKVEVKAGYRVLLKDGKQKDY